jgi:hypothetical protein
VASFPLRYGRYSGPFLGSLGLGARVSGVEVADGTVTVRMGWAFSGAAPAAAVVGAELAPSIGGTRGVHGWGGDWLVNGAGDGMVEIRFAPPMAARTLGIPLKVRRLRVAVADPDELLAQFG